MDEAMMTLFYPESYPPDSPELIKEQ